jgi:tetratricopeptide (TPR) repeat protein
MSGSRFFVFYVFFAAKLIEVCNDRFPRTSCAVLLPTSRPSPASRAFRFALAFVACFCAATSEAHLEIEAALTRLNGLIAASPAEASLYLERGELYAKHEDWITAEANYLRAAELAPNLPRLELLRGSLALATGALLQARDHFDRALELNPRDAEALIFRSRTRARLNDRTGAVADLDAGLQLVANPRPELFLERASLLATPAEAIRSLDAGMARIGPAYTLQSRALELEEAHGLIDAALARLTSIAAQSERKEMWLKRRGDLLARAGRVREARTAYAEALAAIAMLPKWLRESPDTAELIAELARLAPTHS